MYFSPMLWICDILVRIRIHGSVRFFAYFFLKVHPYIYINFLKRKSHKTVKI
jgi:hypothetical protein